jgi:hypothetical protein
LGIIVFVFFFFPKTIHWFVIPTFLCGILLSPDMINWLRGKYDLFDPKGLFGFLGFYLFFVSPILWVALDYQMVFYTNPTDWRPLFGWMQVFNVFGLLAYKLGHNLGYNTFRPPEKHFQISSKKLFSLAPLFILITFLAWIYLVFSVGGLRSFSILEPGSTLESLSGRGWLIVIGRLWPLFIYIIFLHRIVQREKRASFYHTFLLVFLCTLLYFIVDGLRGSRSSVIFMTIYFLTLAHYFVRRLKLKILSLTFVLLLLFLYFYGFYKARGIEAVLLLKKGEITTLIEETKHQRNLPLLLLEDLSRIGVQSLILNRLTERPTDYHLRWGSTYLSAILSIIPSKLRPFSLPGKVEAGTEILYGSAPGALRGYRSSRVYGLAGEAMLNFHIPGMLIAYLLWGILLGRYRKWVKTLKKGDSRFLLVGFLSIVLTLIIPIGDADNLLPSYLPPFLILTIFTFMVSVRKVLYINEI